MTPKEKAIKTKHLILKAKRMVDTFGKENSLKTCEKIILEKDNTEKYLSSTRTYWKDLKKEIEKL